MTDKRRIEIFSAGCPACNDAIETVERLASRSCETEVLDMMEPEVAARAKQLGINRVPAILVDGKLAECCANRQVDKDVLRTSGVGGSKSGCCG